jgi:2-aminoethylphosphonate-pyruvate transaminase
MLRDLGSRDFAFIEMVRDLRVRLLSLAEAEGMGYEAVPMQGSGTFSIEAVFSSCVPPGGEVILLVNGAYGQRMKRICEVLRIPAHCVHYAENEPVRAEDAAAAIAAHPAATLLAMVHCETTTGILNPVSPIGALCAERGLRFFVDAMSSFGAVPLNVPAANIDYLVSSANKCIEGVPGFGFVLARREALLETEGWARSLSLDLLAQWQGLEKDGQFRFTPPTHALLAFHQALLEIEEEGGVAGRAARYRENFETLVAGMRQLGFREYLPPELQGYIITSFRYPHSPNWSFDGFYRRLNERGYVIYPGKVSNADCFRIGNIGRITKADVQDLLAAIRAALDEMGVQLTP